MTRLYQILCWLFLISIMVNIGAFLFLGLPAARMAQFPMLVLLALVKIFVPAKTHTTSP